MELQGVGPKCKTPHERGIPRSDRDLIMNMHNSVRSLVATGNERRGRPGPQPTAANMKQMVSTSSIIIWRLCFSLGILAN